MCINKITDNLNLEVEKLVKISNLLKSLQGYDFISPACKTKIRLALKETDGIPIKANLINLVGSIYQEMIENNAPTEEIHDNNQDNN